MQEEPNKYVKELTQEKYKYGFTTDVHTDIIEKGLNEDVIRLISAKKEEPEWLLAYNGDAYMGRPHDSRNRLSGYFLLCRPDQEKGRSQELG